MPRKNRRVIRIFLKIGASAAAAWSFKIHTWTRRLNFPPIRNEVRKAGNKRAPTVVGAVPVLVPDGRAVGMGSSGHQSFLWDQASSALIVVIHH